MSPDRPFHAPMALLTLAILPAYYRTFAFFRGEPMLAFFLLLGLYLLYRSDGTLKNAALVGVCAGLAILSRQWAVLAIPGALIYAVVLARWRWKQIAVAALLIALVAGWFFVSLTIRFGSPTEYVLSLGAQPYPIDFLTGTGKGMLFSRPVRFAYDQQLFPVFYTDLWGDYWGYWAGHTAAYVNAGWLPILSRMNLVNLLPTAVVLYALVRNLRQRQYWLLYLALASTALGYFAYLIHYPTWDSDTIKASYMLQMYPMVALIVGGFLARYWRAALPIGIALLLHNSILLTWHGYPIYLPES